MIVGRLGSRTDGLSIPCWIVQSMDVPAIASTYTAAHSYRGSPWDWLVYTCPQCLRYAGMMPGTDRGCNRDILETWLRRYGWKYTAIPSGNRVTDRLLRCTYCIHTDLAFHWRSRDPDACMRHQQIASDFMQAVGPFPPAEYPRQERI